MENCYFRWHDQGDTLGSGDIWVNTWMKQQTNKFYNYLGEKLCSQMSDSKSVFIICILNCRKHKLYISLNDWQHICEYLCYSVNHDTNWKNIYYMTKAIFSFAFIMVTSNAVLMGLRIADKLHGQYICTVCFYLTTKCSFLFWCCCTQNCHWVTDKLLPNLKLLRLSRY